MPEYMLQEDGSAQPFLERGWRAALFHGLWVDAVPLGQQKNEKDC